MTELEADCNYDLLTSELRDRLVAASTDGRELGPERIAQWVDAEVGILDSPTRRKLTQRIINESFGLGPLEPLMSDPAVDEIMVSGTNPVWVERHGCLEATPVRFETERELRHVIERILAPLGRRVDDGQPLVDARLSDGSRVNIVVPPLALDGPALTIRRFRQQGFSPADLVEHGTVTPDLIRFLERAVKAKCNILVCGGTGSGKTTTLNALSAFIGANERVITIEDAAELALQQPHVVRLEARTANLEGTGEISIRELVRNALRMRPDRIIVGEVRGGEALDMLTAMSTGHEGSLATVHAGTPTEAVRRLELLALMADIDLPNEMVRAQVADAIDLIVCQSRCSDGSRRVVAVAEVTRVAGGCGVSELYRLRGERSCWPASLSEDLRMRLGFRSPVAESTTRSSGKSSPTTVGIG